MTSSGAAPRRCRDDAAPAARLPEVIVIGAMKCGTTALHRYLDLHPQIAMSRPKELNFFFGPASPPGTVGAGTGAQPDQVAAGAPPARGAPAGRSGPTWETGNWHRGAGWYAGRLDPEAPVRGESSPGYTSPDHPEVAERMARLVPRARLIYLVRDPLGRALSQYRHHRRDGTEQRPLETALLDPGSQYVSRSRYHERLRPFLRWFAPEQIAVVEHRELRDARAETLSRLYAFLGVDAGFASARLRHEWHMDRQPEPQVPTRLRDAFAAAVIDDVERLRALTGRELAHWRVR